jgi:transcriptional regulator with XRE-family HTH domain
MSGSKFQYMHWEFNLGAQLQQRRTELQISREQIYQDLGIGDTSLKYLEEGSTANIKELLALISYLRLSVVIQFEGHEQPIEVDGHFTPSFSNPTHLYYNS